MDTLSKDDLATILWALDSKTESILQANVDKDETEYLKVQKKLYEQLHTTYLKVYDMWKRNDSVF